jgi:hypothetical protein
LTSEFDIGGYAAQTPRDFPSLHLGYLGNSSSKKNHSMNRYQLLFYVTKQDLAPLLSSLEVQQSLQYTLTGMFDVNRLQTYFSYADIPDFGRASHPNANGNPTYLVSPRGTPLRFHEVPQEAGGICFAISQMLNDDTIIFSPGGWYGNGIILYGSVGTVSNSVTSKTLYNFFAKAFRRYFQKVQEFYVGAEALNLAKGGVRLTIGASSPPEFDLSP